MWVTLLLEIWVNSFLGVAVSRDGAAVGVSGAIVSRDEEGCYS